MGAQSPYSILAKVVLITNGNSQYQVSSVKNKRKKEKFIGPKPRKDTGRAHKMENLRSRIPGDGI